MTISVLGPVVSPTGLAIHYDAFGEPEQIAYTPPLAYAAHQPAPIAVHLEHDTSWQLGEVVALERSDQLGLFAAATLTADAADLLAEHGPWYWSDRISSYGDGPYRAGIEIRELSLVPATANTRTKPVAWATGDFDPEPRPLNLWWRDSWQRAKAARGQSRYRRAPDVMDIVDLDRQALDAAVAAAMPQAVRRPSFARSAAADEARRYIHRTGIVTNFG
jgi:hypothetical protein